MKCLENVGMLSTEPVEFEGHKIVPIQFLKALLPDPATLGPRTVGKTNIGCIFTGKKGRQGEEGLHLQHLRPPGVLQGSGLSGHFLHHRRARHGGAMMLLTGKWSKPGVYTVEEFDPDPYMDALNQWGLPWQIDENPVLVD